VIASARAALATRGLQPIWLATVALFAVSPILAPGSLDGSALLSMLPFAAILAVAGIGQTLVVQQRGLDLSVPGTISLTTLIVTRVPGGDDGRLPEALVLALLVCLAAGLISGIAVTRFGITPLVATLGVNALAIGAILQVTNGTSTSVAPPGLSDFALGKTAGIPNTVIVAVLAVIAVTVVIRATVPGRRFVAVGSSPTAAYVAGLRVRRYVIATYACASVASGLAGVMLAGFLQTPGLLPGDGYLLPTIAAVVLGGTSLAGGTGSVLATAGGALFLTQLQQVVLGVGASPAAELVIQGLIIALGMALRTVRWREIARPARRSGGNHGSGPGTGAPPSGATQAEGGGG
jgi:ribose transport system permease protein